MDNEIHCLECHYEGEAKKITKGHFLLEVVLWFCFLVPGIIYSFWRITSGRYKGCPDCLSSKVIAKEKWEERKDLIAQTNKAASM